VHETKGMSDRIDKFQAASRNLQLQPLFTEEERKNFLVEHGSDCIDRLEQKVLDCNESTNQFMFAGASWLWKINATI
jgi:hypothetical protein